MMASEIPCRSGACLKEIVLILIAVWIVTSNARTLTRSPWTRRTLSSLSKEEYLEAMRILKAFNKPAVKTIQTEEGEIFDCVDIYKQPSLDHPLLKNHTVQLRPSFYKKVKPIKRRPTSYPRGVKNRPIPIQPDFRYPCPVGTVHIQRITMQDILTAESPFLFGKKPKGSTFPWPDGHDTSSTPFISRKTNATIGSSGQSNAIEVSGGPFDQSFKL